MKVHILIVISLVLLVGFVDANSRLNFQTPADFESQLVESAPGAAPHVIWTENTSGGNNYVESGYTLISTNTPSPISYSGCTMYTRAGAAHGGTSGWVYLLGSGGSSVWSDVGLGNTNSWERYEVKMVGGDAYVYMNGGLLSQGTPTGTPYYIGWGSNIVDDIVYGSSQPLSGTAPDKYIFGGPETAVNGAPLFYLRNDFTNASNSGFYSGNGTRISEHNVTTTFSKGNGDPEIVEFGPWGGEPYLTYNTGSDYTGEISWDLDNFFSQNPPYGIYTTSIEGAYSKSEQLPYISSGASVSWDNENYTPNQTGVVSYSVSSGYWLTGTYEYRVDVVNIYGMVYGSYPISLQDGTISHPWDITTPGGSYHAVVITTPIGTEDDIWMNFDTAELISNTTSSSVLLGFVHDAQTEAAIPNATISVSQLPSVVGDPTVQEDTTDATGYYVVGNISVGTNLDLVASATGYETYEHTFIPLQNGTYYINITLMPNNLTYNGIAIGGIAREPPYNRPIPTADVVVRNATEGEYYTVQTNSVGFYMKDSLTNNATWYDVWGNKTDFENSSVYQVFAVGA